MSKRQSKKSETPVKRETIEEFIARGGKVTQVPAAPIPEEEYATRTVPTTNATSTMMTLGEGALYYSESRAKPKERKQKVEEAINFAALPSSLLKYMPKRNGED